MQPAAGKSNRDSRGSHAKARRVQDEPPSRSSLLLERDLRANARQRLLAKGNRIRSIGSSPVGMLSRSCSGGLNARFFASACASSEDRDRWTAHAFLPAWLHQNEQPKLCNEAFIASDVCLQLCSMAGFADGFLAISSHALRVWSSCAL